MLINFTDKNKGNWRIWYFLSSFLVLYLINQFLELEKSYNFNPKDINVEIFLETVDNLINLDPIKSNKSRYYQFKSYILTKLKLYEEAIEALDAAITFDPKRIDLYYSTNKIYIQNKEGDQALKLLETLRERFPQKSKKFERIQHRINY